MRKYLCLLPFAFCLCVFDASAYQLLSSKELGRNDAKNQNVVVKCTTDAGKVSNQTCTLRRYAKCATPTSCKGWQPWRNLQSPAKTYTDWRTGAAECCRAKGLR